MEHSVNKINKNKINIKWAFYLFICLSISLWIYLLNNKLLFILPIFISILLYKWCDYSYFYLNENNVVKSFIISIIILCFTVFLFVPASDVIRNGLTLSFINFRIMFHASVTDGSLVSNSLIIFGLFFLFTFIFLIFNKVFSKYISYFSYNSFSKDVCDVISYFKDKKATSVNKCIEYDNALNKHAFSFLLKQGLIKENDKKYFLSFKKNDNIDDLILNRFNKNSKKVSSFIVICIIFLLVASLSSFEPVNNTIIGSDYSFSIPTNYLITAGDSSNSFSLSPRSDISGNSGIIYLDIIPTDNASYDNEVYIEYCKSQYEKTEGSTSYTYTSYSNQNDCFVVENELTFVDHYLTIFSVFVTDRDNNSLELITIQCNRPNSDLKLYDDAKKIVDSISFVQPKIEE